MRCPCRKKSETVDYAACCQPYHRGVRAAPTAEALMRSRYAAFALKEAAYVRATWHLSTRPATMEFSRDQEWQSLQVRAAIETGDSATVEFVARSRTGGTSHVLHEVSRFVREGERWYYIDGAVS